MKKGQHQIRRNSTWILFLCVLLLSSCGGSSTDVGISSKSQYGNYHVPVSKTAVITSSEGTYKIGNPYRISGIWYTPKEDYGYAETGTASWYGADFHNGVTANGEKYDMDAMTAAHRTLPLPSVVKVTNLSNGKSVILRVNDRGPFAKNRIIDVSRKAAQQLNFINQGTTKVKVEVLPEESRALKNKILAATGKKEYRMSEVNYVKEEKLIEPMYKAPRDLSRTKGVFVQAGAFSDKNNADKVRRDIDALDADGLYQSGISQTDKNLYRVRIGPFENREAATKILAEVHRIGYPGAKIVEEK